MTTVTPCVRTYKHTHYSQEKNIFQYENWYGLPSIHETRWKPLLPINIPGAFICSLFSVTFGPKMAGFFAGGILNYLSLVHIMLYKYFMVVSTQLLVLIVQQCIIQYQMYLQHTNFSNVPSVSHCPKLYILSVLKDRKYPGKFFIIISLLSRKYSGAPCPVINTTI